MMLLAFSEMTSLWVIKVSQPFVSLRVTQHSWHKHSNARPLCSVTHRSLLLPQLRHIRTQTHARARATISYAFFCIKWNVCFPPSFSHGFISHSTLFIAAWLVAIRSLFWILHKICCLHKTKNCFVFYEKASIWYVFIGDCFLDSWEVLIGNWERGIWCKQIKYGFS